MGKTCAAARYISTACNKTANILDWSSDNLLCYGACNSVVIWDPKAVENKVKQVLNGHTERVNCVRWVNDSSILFSASTDGKALIWVSDNGVFTLKTALNGHESSVTLVDGIYIDKGLIVVTASADSSVKIWNIDGEVTQNIAIKNGICISLKLHKFIDNGIEVPILVTSTSNCGINIYAGVPNDFGNLEFVFLTTLKGHEGWIYGLDLTTDDEGNMLLASSSKDTYIRLWKLSTQPQNQPSDSDEIQVTQNIFEIQTPKKTIPFTISLESILSGHEGWVYSVHWHPKINQTQPMKLLSTSMDKTIIIWNQDPTTGIWIDSVRVGEVGGNTLGFYGGKFSPCGSQIIAHGFQGSFHSWKYNKTWEPQIVIGGHFGEVVDLGWEPQGEFLLSVSTDQTTRCHAPWVSEVGVTWHEIARPQVHGYDMSCLAMLSRYRFASGAEEKVIRVFEAPHNFVQNFRNICKIENDTDGDKINFLNLPKGASVPSLGLSNKAVFESDQKSIVKEEYPDTSYFTEIELNEPPTEENLIQNTLWPEIQKLYGHGYELFAMAATSDGQILASVCKATKPEHAAIILWDTAKWQQTHQLLSHTLTVTQLKFSPNNQYLLSVSRDRRWSLFQAPNWNLIASTDKKTCLHARIIWTCSWSSDSKYFVTGSRDGKVIIWNLDGVGNVLNLKNESITAIDFAPKVTSQGYYVLAIGFESGKISLWKWLNKWEKIEDLSEGHCKTIRKLSFRPVTDLTEDLLHLASCGNDHFVRITEINFKEL